jgi:hypothetical protein
MQGLRVSRLLMRDSGGPLAFVAEPPTVKRQKRRPETRKRAKRGKA